MVQERLVARGVAAEYLDVVVPDSSGSFHLPTENDELLV
jgi:hypothetical protein